MEFTPYTYMYEHLPLLNYAQEDTSEFPIQKRKTIFNAQMSTMRHVIVTGPKRKSIAVPCLTATLLAVRHSRGAYKLWWIRF